MEFTRKHNVFKAKSEGNRQFTFAFSSNSVDRDNDTIAQLGIKFDDYKNNPVVLWAHDYATPPVARAKSLFWRDEKLHGTIEFPPEGTSQLADEVHNLVAAGFINAVSIGFLPKTYLFNEERGGYDFAEVELMEVSLVPVPSNRDALRTAKEIRGWAKNVLRDEETKAAAKAVLDENPGPTPDKIAEVTDLEPAAIEPEHVEKPMDKETASHVAEAVETTHPREFAEAIRKAVREELTAAVREEVNYRLGRLD